MGFKVFFMFARLRSLFFILVIFLWRKKDRGKNILLLKGEIFKINYLNKKIVDKFVILKYFYYILRGYSYKEV